MYVLSFNHYLEDFEEDQRRAGHNTDKAVGEVGRKVVREVAEGKC